MAGCQVAFCLPSSLPALVVTSDHHHCPCFPRPPGSWDLPLYVVLPTVSWDNFSPDDPAQLSHEVLLWPIWESIQHLHVKFWKCGSSNTALPLPSTVVGATGSSLLRWGRSSTLPCKGENEAHHTEISPRKPQSLHFLSIAWWVFTGGLWHRCSPILGPWQLFDLPPKLILKIQLCVSSTFLCCYLNVLVINLNIKGCNFLLITNMNILK